VSDDGRDDDGPGSDAPEAGPSDGIRARRRTIPLWRQRRYQIGAGVLAVLLVAGVASAIVLSGGDSPATTTSAKRTTTTRPGPTTTTAYSGPIAPLTGLPDIGGAAQGRPAMTVKIDNSLEEGPKRGVDQADIVYEEVIESGYTRLAAIFHSQVPSDVGPIRSVRKTDQALVRPIGGIFVYSGGAAYAEESIATAPVNRINETGAGDAMYRDDNRRGPWDLFGLGPDLFALGGDPKPPPALFSYRAVGRVVIGDAAARVVVGFESDSEVVWDWDARAGTWNRTYHGALETVESGTQIAPKNVVIQFVRYDGGTGSVGAEGVVAGEGEAWVLTDGKVVKGRWSRPDPALPGQLLDASGRPILLTPGQTWVELPDVDYEVTITEARR